MADGLPIFLHENHCLLYHFVHHKADIYYHGIDLNIREKDLTINLLTYGGKIS
jgi:hypothetical protein